MALMAVVGFCWSSSFCAFGSRREIFQQTPVQTVKYRFGSIENGESSSLLAADIESSCIKEYGAPSGI